MHANELINYFCTKFKLLYGEKNLTYKLHAHTHLPAQVVQYGPLHEISCFPFESIFYQNNFVISINYFLKQLNLLDMFKMYKDYIHGTRGYTSQINERILVNSFINTNKDKILDGMACFQMKSFIESLKKRNQPNVCIFPPKNYKYLFIF